MLSSFAAASPLVPPDPSTETSRAHAGATPRLPGVKPGEGDHAIFGGPRAYNLLKMADMGLVTGELRRQIDGGFE